MYVKFLKDYIMKISVYFISFSQLFFSKVILLDCHYARLFLSLMINLKLFLIIFEMECLGRYMTQKIFFQNSVKDQISCQKYNFYLWSQIKECFLFFFDLLHPNLLFLTMQLCFLNYHSSFHSTFIFIMVLIHFKKLLNSIYLNFNRSKLFIKILMNHMDLYFFFSLLKIHKIRYS